MCVYSLVARNCSDGSIKLLVFYPANGSGDFLDYLDSHLSLIPDMYYESPYRLYCIVDDDFDQE